MPAIVVLGAQWGDEGKGKLVDILAKRSVAGGWAMALARNQTTTARC